MNFYKRFIGDIQAKTGSLSLAEFGAYDRLLDHYYSTEEPIPLDAGDRYRICRAMSEEERCAVDKVIAKFFTETPAGYVQSKAEEVISAALPLIEAARENGKKGGRPRKEKPTGFSGETQDEPSAKASQSQNQNSPSLRSGESAAKPRAARRLKSDCNLQSYLDVCKAAGQKPLPTEHPIRAWCADAGITEEMLQVAWCVFRDDHLTGKNKDKKQKDWPAHFANSVRRRWYQLWFTGDQGVAWTSNGLQEKAVLEARMKAREEANAPA
jgi:uncharacterized protein YdaU (DUF1376 family)